MADTAKNRPRVKIDSLDELFNLGKDEPPETDNASTVVVSAVSMVPCQFPLESLVPFKDHPFRLYTGERLDDMIESIKNHGILTPILAREKENGTYEILSGHNRVNAAKLVGYDEVPVIVKENLSDEEAWIYVIETNLMQRSFSDMLHSEKAAVLAIQHSKLFSQGKRNDIIAELNALQNSHDSKEKSTCGQVDHKLSSREKVADEHSLSPRNVARYLRISQLSLKLKDMLDDGSIAFLTGVTLSFLSEKEQNTVTKSIELNEFKLDMKKADLLRSYSENGKLDDDNTYLILNGELGKKPRTKEPPFKLTHKVFAKYFTSNQKKSEIEGIIDQALSMFFNQQNQKREAETARKPTETHSIDDEQDDEMEL